MKRDRIPKAGFTVIYPQNGSLLVFPLEGEAGGRAHACPHQML